MQPIILRPYQQTGIDEIRSAFGRGLKGVLFCSPTGSGKTLTAAYILLNASRKGNHCFFCVNRIELVEQTAEALQAMGIDFGYICAGMPYSPHKMVHICMVQTLSRRLDRVPAPDFIVWDECRGIAAAGLVRIYDAYPKAKHLGLDATPERPDGTGLGKWFSHLVMGPTYHDLQDVGALVPFRVLTASKVTTEGLHTVRGDFDEHEVAERMNKREITGDAVAHFKALDGEHRCLTFAANIEHSINIAAAYREAGIPWAHVDGETPEAERRQALRALRNGSIRGISNVDLFVAGLDVTEIDTIQWLRMTQSLPRFLQGCGRGSRPHPGKTHCTLLDHAANVGEIIKGEFHPRHGLPDQDREWSLESKKKSKRAKSDAQGLKKCPKCQGMVESFKRTCGAPVPGGRCDHTFVVVERKGPEVVDGTLIEVDPKTAAIARKRENWEAKTMKELVALGAKRGYKSPWVWAQKVFDARQEKKAYEGAVKGRPAIYPRSDDGMCREPGCGKPHHRSGLCCAHYFSHRRAAPL